MRGVVRRSSEADMGEHVKKSVQRYCQGEVQRLAWGRMSSEEKNKACISNNNIHRKVAGGQSNAKQHQYDIRLGSSLKIVFGFGWFWSFGLVLQFGE